MRHDPTGVDIRWVQDGSDQSAKVRIDDYFGTDLAKIADRRLTFYRKDAGAYALEAISDTASRTPGWVLTSMATQLFYYRIVIGRPEEEVAALLDSPDGVFFSELAPERDELRIIPMRELQSWFDATNERHTPRPVMSGGRSTWQRIVPMSELDAAVQGVRVVGPVYSQVAFR